MTAPVPEDEVHGQQGIAPLGLQPDPPVLLLYLRSALVPLTVMVPLAVGVLLGWSVVPSRADPFASLPPVSVKLPSGWVVDATPPAGPPVGHR